MFPRVPRVVADRPLPKAIAIRSGHRCVVFDDNTLVPHRFIPGAFAVDLTGEERCVNCGIMQSFVTKWTVMAPDAVIFADNYSDAIRAANEAWCQQLNPHQRGALAWENFARVCQPIFDAINAINNLVV